MSAPAVEPRAGPAGESEHIDLARQDLARPTVLMALGTALSRLTGLGRFTALAIALGVAESRLADSYNVANTLPIILYELVLGGVLTSVFIPILVEELRTKPRAEAWESVSNLVTTAMLVVIAVSALTLAIAPWVIDVFTGRAHGAAGESERHLATFFLRLFSPQVALFGFAAIATGLLNVHGKFALPTFAPIVNNVVIIASFLIFAAVTAGTPTSGSVDADLGQKLLLGLGTTGGVAAMALAYGPSLRRLPGRIRARVDLHHPALRKLGRLSVWTLVYVGFNALGTAVSFYLASGVQGGLTAYVSAFAFFQLPIGIAAISVITALTPKMAAHFVDGDSFAFRARASGGLRLCALLMLPAMVLYLVLSKPLIHVLLEHGVTHGKSAALVASVLKWFAIGLLPFAVFQLLRAAFYARQDARTPAYVNIVENVVTVALDFALFPVMHVQGLALAHGLGYVVGCAVGIVPLVRRIGGLETRATLVELTKVVAASAGMWLAMTGAVAVVAGTVGAGDARSLVELVVGTGVGAAAFLALARLLRVRELHFFTTLIPWRPRLAER